ncbi:protein translocase subunit SecD [Calidifontibacter sp. DB0510]|uniref:Protein translocase subunit SecD n=1 Tax=Metallococcus carri TaxID=1656884 RepID=A0A967B433_9MICO|nr:protein translocase subunit SecD [Metallococcus carri]NHN56990.1 protein translocase subunit SecD [Metallococcus carri]NOP37735.1 protein translocase subunit SecD [Calidifontibacter sp. DB2511S]
MATRARRAPAAKPRRTLFLLLVLIAALFAGIGASAAWGNPKGQWTPKLGLDLEGGRQVILQPELGKGQTVNAGQLNQAVNIIRNRVDGSGVAEAEVTTLGSENIVVSIPGNPSKQILDSLAQSSQLLFRAVIATGQPQADQTPAPTLPGATPSAPATSAPTGTGTAKPSGSASAKPSSSVKAPSSSAKAAPSSTGKNDAFPAAFAAATGTPTGSGSGSAAPAASSTPAPTSAAPSGPPTLPGATGSASPSTTPGKPANASDQAWANQLVSRIWIDAGLAQTGETYQQLLQTVSCSNTNPKLGPLASTWQEVAARAPANEPSVGCSKDKSATFLMGPSEVSGDTITDATWGQTTNSAGIQTGEIAVNLTFNDKGKTQFANVTRRLVGLQGDQNRFAIIVDGQIISAPGTNDPITDGRAQITGGFTEAEAKILADQLKFGALPFSFKELSSDQISPQLGIDQLQKGIIAGLIGLLLVVFYSLLQYRALGLVTVASLLVAGVMSYGLVTFLGFANNFRLTMAGVTGLIVAIGITADSFIVYFERVRDEVRSGRPLRAAVETGWSRARRTIIISDAVNFLAAAVLYVLSESTVKAFAFTLGLTTLVDLVVVMLFTHPVLTMLARTKFFGGGHKWSGLDPERLGARGTTYAGRGRVTIADRKQAAAQGGTV